MSTFHGKVCAITGAGSGIGQALALLLAKKGAKLWLCDINEAGLNETKRRAGNAPCEVHVLDVSSKEAVEGFVSGCIEHYGQLDAIVNNAGVTVQDTWQQISYEDIDWLLGINLYGVLYGTKAALPHFLERDTGWIVNISSIFGMIAVPTQGAYNVSKFAVRALNESLQSELSDTNVTCCSVHPGGIRTNIVRNARLRRDVDGGPIDESATVSAFDRLARTSPERAAEIIVRGMERKERRILVGLDAKIIDSVQRALPKRYQDIFLKLQAKIDR